MNTESRYNAVLDYLYSFVDYSLKHASELAKAEFNLERMRALMSALGNPQDAYPCIHVAGTKGKGSVSALCASALSASGRKIGLYTSPHLQDFAERIQVGGRPIPHDDLATLVDEAKPAVASVPFLTTFEITTALGFLYFAHQQVDAAVIEVGLGGRLDATNVITPRVAVITALSYDHTAVLGNTLTAIAGEKAGIIKTGVPLVASPQKQEALQVLEDVAAERNAPLTLVGRDVVYTVLERSLDRQAFELSFPDRSPLKLTIPLLGEHQVENAASACAALRAGGFSLSDAEVRRGFAAVRWSCRFEIAQRENPTVIFDSAHNEDSFVRLVQTLTDYFPERKVTLLFGASEDKHVAAMLAAIRPKLAHLILTRSDHPRALEPEALVETAKKAGLQPETLPDVETALPRALEISRKDGSIVLAAGSIFLSAAVKSVWETGRRQL